jgi:hypothetical protein
MVPFATSKISRAAPAFLKGYNIHLALQRSNCSTIIL